MFLGATLVARALAAQQPIVVGTELDRYVRLLELDGDVQRTPLVYRSSSLQPHSKGLTASATHPWALRYPLRPRLDSSRSIRATLLELDGRLVYNSAFPRGFNDGALWAGRGVSATLSGGAQATWGPVTARLYPTLVFAQNRAFTLAPISLANVIPGRSPYSYPWQRLGGSQIDWPQRFGASSMKRADWGQSVLRFDLGAFTAGFSTENLWWGPAFRNAIIMTNSAPGFPHLDVGMGRPWFTLIGEVEIRAVWGSLTRSEFFGTASTDGRRFFTGLTLGYRPRFLPGLTLGIARVLYQEWPAGGLTAGDVFATFGRAFKPATVLPGGGLFNDVKDQMASLMARWVVPSGGLEAYVEWARNDFAGFLRDFLLEPDHARAFTAGFQKTVRSGTARWLVNAEFTSLGLTPTIVYRPAPSFYMHEFAKEGYTHRGELLGAGIGPGSNSQYLGVDRYGTQGRWGVFVERVRYNDDAYYFGAVRDMIVSLGERNLRHQMDLTVGASAVRFVEAFEIGASIELTHEYNRYFQLGADVGNLKTGLSLKWRGN